MNYIEVNGGNKYQKKVAYVVVEQMIKALMPRMRTLEITVNIRKFTDDAIGYCMMEDTNREFEIEVSKDLSLKDFVTALCHEMVHAKQYARNEMSGDVTDRHWKKSLRLQTQLVIGICLGKKRHIEWKINWHNWFGMQIFCKGY